MTQTDTNRKRRNDWLFIAGLLILVSVAGLLFYFLRGEGDRVEIKVDGKVYATYSLSEDRQEDILTGDGQCNRLVIKDGQAYVETATCPDGICAGHSPIHREGESIVCLPHRVVITVISAAPEQGPDIVV